jgi:hypothetical protein
MLNIDQHLERVGQCHREEVKLVQSHLILSNTLEKSREQRSIPVKESAAGGLSYVPFPVGDDIDLPSVEVEALLLFFFKDVIKDETLAVVDYCFSQKIETSIQTLSDCLSQVS